MKKETKSPVTLESLAKTIEKLAISTARGFEEAEEERKKHQEKEEKRFEAIDNSLKEVFDQLSIIRSEVRDTKGTLGPLARAVKMQNEELTDLHLRVGVLERKAGIERR